MGPSLAHARRLLGVVRPRRLHALGVFFAAALLLLLAIAISIRIEVFGHLHADAASAPTTPVALILGAEVYADGQPSPALSNRLDVGIELLRLGRVRALLMSGGNGTFEVGAMRAYAIARGVSSDVILLDAAGERTFASCTQARDAFAAHRLTGRQSGAPHDARRVHLPTHRDRCRRRGRA
jgi:vancomycin permeability regulator SanA